MNALLQKLKLSQGETLLLLNLPVGLEPLFSDTSYHTKAAQGSTYSTLLLFVHEVAELEQWAPQALEALESGGKLWIAYPKKSSGHKTDIHRDQGWHLLVQRGYGAVAAVSIDATWSALRFKPEDQVQRTGEYRTNQPLKKAGNRTLEIPDYLQQLLEQHPSEKAFFDGLAYTHRKEWVYWITDAKKEETRQRRLEQMLSMLREGKKGR